jgi:nucleotide-binding universal stress UspA family protein
VLFATDGSRRSNRAARLAGRIAASHDCELIALHVDDSADAESRRALARETVELLEATGREPAFIEASGDAHKEINRLAVELGAGLVVVGSSGRGRAKALGSVSERVAKATPCSVLVARPA